MVENIFFSRLAFIERSVYCRRLGGGNAYAITSMRKVELELEFNFPSGSDFLSRVVRQMFSIPFVS